MNATLSALRHAAVFSGLEESAIAELSELGREVHFPAGTPLMRQGEPAHELYVLVSGRVSVERVHTKLVLPLQLAVLGAGDVVGEMGVLDGEPRSATVTAIEPTTALALGAPALAIVMLKSAEVAIQLLRVVSRRLRSTDELAESMLIGGTN